MIDGTGNARELCVEKRLPISTLKTKGCCDNKEVRCEIH